MSKITNYRFTLYNTSTGQVIVRCDLGWDVADAESSLRKYLNKHRETKPTCNWIIQNVEILH